MVKRVVKAFLYSPFLTESPELQAVLLVALASVWCVRARVCVIVYVWISICVWVRVRVLSVSLAL